MSLIKFLVTVVLLLPLMARANDASDFTGASSAEQVRLLEKLGGKSGHYIRAEGGYV